MGRQVFTAGEILTAANMNDLGDATVMVFDDATARTTAIPTPVEGMVTYLKDTDLVEVFDGSAFVPVAIEPDPPAILQVVSTKKTDTFSASMTAGSLTAITGLSATITPTSASSKILVFVDVTAANTGGDNNGAGFGVRLKRDSTPIGVGAAAGNRVGVNAMGLAGVMNNASTNVAFNHLDSPATTSALTYSTEIYHGNSITQTVIVNRTPLDGDVAHIGRSASTITLMEVAG